MPPAATAMDNRIRRLWTSFCLWPPRRVALGPSVTHTGWNTPGHTTPPKHPVAPTSIQDYTVYADRNLSNRHSCRQAHDCCVSALMHWWDTLMDQQDQWVCTALRSLFRLQYQLMPGRNIINATVENLSVFQSKACPSWPFTFSWPVKTPAVVSLCQSPTSFSGD